MDQTINQDWWDRRKALDPSIYKNKFYKIDVATLSVVNGVGDGAVTLDSTPFILDSIAHVIVGALPEDQDGQYSVLWRDEYTNYSQEQVMAEPAFGSIRSGFFVPLPLRSFFRSSATISMEVTNYIDRTADFPVSFPLQFVLHGFEKWDRPRV